MAGLLCMLGGQEQVPYHTDAALFGSAAIGLKPEEVYNTERQLLYVACTRARDHLLVIGVAPISEFVEDMRL